MSNPTYVSGLLFTKAHRLVRERIYELLEDYRLNPTSWAILSAIMSAGEGIRSSNVAQLIGVKPPMITMLTEDLINRELIGKVPHPTDGRAKLLVMTPKGKKMALVIEVALNKIIMDLLTGLSSEEIASFQKTLDTIIKNAT